MVRAVLFFNTAFKADAAEDTAVIAAEDAATAAIAAEDDTIALSAVLLLITAVIAA